MSLQPGDFRPIERVTSAGEIRRIKRDQSIQEFGRKHQEGRKDGKRPPHSETPEEETPQDVVEVSTEYHPSAAPHTAASPFPARPASNNSAPGTPPLAERHLNIGA